MNIWNKQLPSAQFSVRLQHHKGVIMPIPMNRQHVHLSADQVTAVNVAKRRKRKWVILQVNARLMQSRGHEFYKSENDVWLTDEVPVKYISKVRHPKK